jgi:hypothetical protein
MATQSFYLLGDDVSTARPISIDPTWKPEDIKRAVGLVFHVAQPLGEKTLLIPALFPFVNAQSD